MDNFNPWIAMYFHAVNGRDLKIQIPTVWSEKATDSEYFSTSRYESPKASAETYVKAQLAYIYGDMRAALILAYPQWVKKLKCRWPIKIKTFLLRRAYHYVTLQPISDNKDWKLDSIIVLIQRNYDNKVRNFSMLCRKLGFALTSFCPCDLKSYEALFTALWVNHLYHQMNLWAWIK